MRRAVEEIEIFLNRVKRLWGQGGGWKCAIIAVAFVLLLVICSCVKSCGGSSVERSLKEAHELAKRQAEERVMVHKKLLAEQRAKEKLEQEIEQEKRRQVADAQKNAMLELRRGDEEAVKCALTKIRTLPHDIIVEKKLPIVTVCGATLCEPLPEKLLDFARGSKLELKEKFIVFEKMELSQSSASKGVNGTKLCDRIKLYAKTPKFTSFTQAVSFRNEIIEQLHMYFKPAEFSLTGYEEEYDAHSARRFGFPGTLSVARWTGTPEWRSTLSVSKEGIVLEIEALHYSGFMRQILDERLEEIDNRLRADSEQRRLDLNRKYKVDIPKVTSTFLF